MQKQFEILNTTRNNILKSVEDLSLKQLNTVPSGFKNSVAWNIAHLVVTQQLLCYKLSNLELNIDASFVDRFKKGSGVSEISQSELLVVKAQLMELPIKLKEDYAIGLFKSFNEYPTSYGVTLLNIEDAIQFNNVHEGLHFGYIMAMKKQLITK